MTKLKVRKIDFQFDDDIAYQWNHGNPAFGKFANFVTLIVPAFERYIIKAIRDAIPLISDSHVKRDAKLFCQQEAQHAKHHLAHIKLLSNRYPGLEETRKEVMASYERLYQRESLEFHLAYAAFIELAFGPSARFMVENRDRLFKQSDTRIASFLLWHAVEEFEHRNAAIDIYNDVVGKYGYRMSCLIPVLRHGNEIARITRDGFDRHVPPKHRMSFSEIISSLKDIPLSSLGRFYFELFCTLLPFHRPDHLDQPEWATRWFEDDTAGGDMRRYYQAYE